MLTIKSHVRTELTPELIQLLLVWIFVITAVFPILSAYVFLRSGMIKSLQMEDKRERIGPYLLTAFYYGLAYYMLSKNNFPDALYALLLGSIVAILCIAIISWFWKISAHMVGIGGVTGALTGFGELYGINLGTFIAGMILLAGVIGTSRLHLKSHRPMEVYAGMVLGFLIMYLFMKYKILI